MLGSDAPRQLVPIVTFTNKDNRKINRVENRMLFNGATSKIIYWLKFGFNCFHGFNFYSFLPFTILTDVMSAFA